MAVCEQEFELGGDDEPFSVPDEYMDPDDSDDFPVTDSLADVGQYSTSESFAAEDSSNPEEQRQQGGNAGASAAPMRNPSRLEILGLAAGAERGRSDWAPCCITPSDCRNTSNMINGLLYWQHGLSLNVGS